MTSNHVDSSLLPFIIAVAFAAIALYSIVVSFFAVESEAFQAFTELRKMPMGEGYTVAEAALLKNQDGITTMEDSFGFRAVDASQTKGIVIGSLVGILGPRMVEQLRADRKADRAARREERRASLKAQFEEYEAATNRAMGLE